LKPKLVKRNKNHFILIKETIQQEEITIVNIHAPNVSILGFIKQILLDIKPQRDYNTLIVDDFNTLLSPVNRSSRQNMCKEISELNDTIDEMDLTDIYRTFHQQPQNEYTLFSAAHGAFSKNKSYLRT
jgi:exonuclease III